MASIIKRKKGNNYYYYVVECQRVDGKPRIVKQTYPGTIKRILEKFEQPLAKPDIPEEVDHKDFGNIAALLLLFLHLSHNVFIVVYIAIPII